MPEGTGDGSLPGEANNYDIDDSDRSRPINLNAFITRLFLHPKLGPVTCKPVEARVFTSADSRSG